MAYTATNNLNDVVENTPTAAEPVSNLGLAMLETRRTYKAVILKEHNADGTHSSVNGAVITAGSIPLSALVGGTALSAGGVATANLADGAVTTAKLAALGVTGATIANKTIGPTKMVGTTTAHIWVVQSDGSLAEVAVSGALTMTAAGVFSLASSVVGQAIAMFAEVEATGAQGGTFTAGAWQLRVLNSTIIDSAAIFNLASNVLTWSTAGTYYIKAESTAYTVGFHQIRLWDPTNNVVLSDGMPACATAEQTVSSAETVINVLDGVTQKLQIQHYCQTTRATDGLGHNPGFGGNSIFSRITIIKLA